MTELSENLLAIGAALDAEAIDPRLPPELRARQGARAGYLRVIANVLESRTVALQDAVNCFPDSGKGSLIAGERIEAWQAALR